MREKKREREKGGGDECVLTVVALCIALLRLFVLAKHAIFAERRLYVCSSHELKYPSTRFLCCVSFVSRIFHSLVGVKNLFIYE